MSNNIETQEELEIVRAVENGEYTPLEGEELAEMKTLLKKAATNTIERLSKRKAINIRLLESDIERVKAMALNEGIPYQTYLSSIIHKVVTGQLKSAV